MDVANCPKEAILDILAMDNVHILRSELVLFEISAKGAKLVNIGKIEEKDLTEGLLALKYQTQIEVIPIHYPEIQITAIKLLKSYGDFIDYLTLASAMHFADVF